MVCPHCGRDRCNCRDRRILGGIFAAVGVGVAAAIGIAAATDRSESNRRVREVDDGRRERNRRRAQFRLNALEEVKRTLEDANPEGIIIAFMHFLG